MFTRPSQTASPAIIQRPIRTNEPMMTSEEILKACTERLAKVTDPPLTMVRRHFNSEWASAVVDQSKKQVTFSLPKGVSEATLNRVRDILTGIVPNHTIAFDTHNEAQLVHITNRELGAGQRSSRKHHADEELSQFTLNPKVIHLHDPRLAQVIEPSLNIE